MGSVPERATRTTSQRPGAPDDRVANPSHSPRNELACASSWPPTAGDVINAPTLKEIFGSETFAAYLLVAAVFGLSPALLVDRGRKETRELQNDIASSEPTRKEQRLSDTV
jgi:hypothetical protein